MSTRAHCLVDSHAISTHRSVGGIAWCIVALSIIHTHSRSGTCCFDASMHTCVEQAVTRVDYVNGCETWGRALPLGRQESDTPFALVDTCTLAITFAGGVAIVKMQS